MKASKWLIARLMTGLGLAVVVVAFGASSASAYPPGTAPTLAASLTLTGTHYSGTVNLVGFSAPVDLGTASAGGADGTFTKTVTITAVDFPVGNHSIVGTDAVGDSASVSFSVTAAGTGGSGVGGGSAGSNGADGNSGGGLAFTGVAVMSIGGLGVLMLIVGGVMLMAGKRRKTTV